MKDDTTFGQPFFPEQEDAPRVCECGGVDTIHIYHNIETDELTLECEECGKEYDSEPEYDMMVLLAVMGKTS